MFIILHIVYIITIPLRLLFRGEPYQNVRYIFCNPPLNVKLVAERPPGVVLVGRVFKVPSKCKLTFSRPPSKTPWNMYLTFRVRPPLKTVVIMCMYIYTHIYRVYRCRERVREGKKRIEHPKLLGKRTQGTIVRIKKILSTNVMVMNVKIISCYFQFQPWIFLCRNVMRFQRSGAGTMRRQQED